MQKWGDHAQGLAGALLTLDTGVALGQSGRLSAMGCAMLAMLLRMPKVRTHRKVVYLVHVDTKGAQPRGSPIDKCGSHTVHAWQPLDAGVALGLSGGFRQWGCAMLAMLLRMPKMCVHASDREGINSSVRAMKAVRQVEAGGEFAEALAPLPEPELELAFLKLALPHTRRRRAASSPRRLRRCLSRSSSSLFLIWLSPARAGGGQRGCGGARGAAGAGATACGRRCGGQPRAGGVPGRPGGRREGAQAPAAAAARRLRPARRDARRQPRRTGRLPRGGAWLCALWLSHGFPLELCSALLCFVLLGHGSPALVLG